MLHEMGHVLGIGTIWQARGLVSGAGTSNPLFTGANAVAAYNWRFSAISNGRAVGKYWWKRDSRFAQRESVLAMK